MNGYDSLLLSTAVIRGEENHYTVEYNRRQAVAAAYGHCGSII